MQVLAVVALAGKQDVSGAVAPVREYRALREFRSAKLSEVDDVLFDRVAELDRADAPVEKIT